MRISRMIPLPWSKRRAMSLLSLDRVGCAAGPDEPGVHCLLDPSQPTLCSLVELLDLFSSIRTLHFRNVTHAWKNVPRDTSRAGDLVRVEASKISENLRVERIISEKDIFLQDRRDAYALWMIGYSPIGRALQYLELSESVFLTIDFFPLFPSLQHLRLHLHEMQRVTPFDVRNVRTDARCFHSCLSPRAVRLITLHQARPYGHHRPFTWPNESERPDLSAHPNALSFSHQYNPDQRRAPIPRSSIRGFHHPRRPASCIRFSG